MTISREIWAASVGLFFACVSVLYGNDLYGNDNGLLIRPYDGDADELQFDLGSDRISLWRCECQAGGTSSLSLSVTAIEGNTTSTLGEISIPLGASTKATAFLAWSTDKKQLAKAPLPPRFLALGAVCEQVQRDTSLKPFVFKQDYLLERSLTPNVESLLASGKCEVLCLFVFSKPRPNEVIGGPSPFTSLKHEDVVRVAKGLADSVVVLVTIQTE